jgi:uncharacterized protein
MVTVIKQDPRGNEKTRYQGEIIKQLANGVIIRAYWTRPALDLGYTRFEPGDHFTEYYYTDRWFNIFDIYSVNGTHKGWYCNIAAPAVINDDIIQQIDLLLDVWVNSQGEPLILDEDEFAQDSTLSEEQRNGARQGLQALLRMLAAHQEMFTGIADHR